MKIFLIIKVKISKHMQFTKFYCLKNFVQANNNNQACVYHLIIVIGHNFYEFFNEKHKNVEYSKIKAKFQKSVQNFGIIKYK